jgi:DHA1 family tetracycline resistance protein-like MFS transporter
MVGLTLAVFGLVMAGFQGFLTGPAVARWGEQKVVMIGLISAVIAMFGYGVVGSLALVIALMIVHGPEGFVHPMLTAILSQRVPENAQGELQGGISAITNVAMLLGTVFFAQVFGYFMREDAPIQSPNVAFVLGGIGLVGTSLFMLAVLKRERRAGQHNG